MEAVIYRRPPGWPLVTTETYEESVCQDRRGLPEPPQKALTLHPVTFYPNITLAELTMWDHWLPTSEVFAGEDQTAQRTFFNRLEELSAPQEVVRECQWAWNMELFEEYTLKTPERRDLRDPLVLGRLGAHNYRIALWGESLRPIEEISALVQHSLALRVRAVKWLKTCMVSGAVLGFGLGLWAAKQLPAEGDFWGVSLASITVGMLVMGMPFLLYTPEHRQQNFLDRYR